MPPFLWPQTSHVAHDVSRPVSILGQLVDASTCRWVNLSMGQLVDGSTCRCHTYLLASFASVPTNVSLGYPLFISIVSNLGAYVRSH